MNPRRPSDRSKPAKARQANGQRVKPISEQENRQPEMSEPIHWLVPDTRDDIVVSQRNED